MSMTLQIQYQLIQTKLSYQLYQTRIQLISVSTQLIFQLIKSSSHTNTHHISNKHINETKYQSNNQTSQVNKSTNNLNN